MLGATWRPLSSWVAAVVAVPGQRAVAAVRAARNTKRGAAVRQEASDRRSGDATLGGQGVEGAVDRFAVPGQRVRSSRPFNRAGAASSACPMRFAGEDDRSIRPGAGRRWRCARQADRRQPRRVPSLPARRWDFPHLVKLRFAPQSLHRHGHREQDREFCQRDRKGFGCEALRWQRSEDDRRLRERHARGSVLAIGAVGRDAERRDPGKRQSAPRKRRHGPEEDSWRGGARPGRAGGGARPRASRGARPARGANRQTEGRAAPAGPDPAQL